MNTMVETEKSVSHKINVSKQVLSRFTYHVAKCTCGWQGHLKVQEIDAKMDGNEHCVSRAIIEGR